MVWSIFKHAIRCLLKDLKYTGINVLGLTVGITCSLFLLIYVLHEVSYDRYHRNAKNIYRIISHIQAPENITTWPVTQPPLGPELKENHPEIKNAVRFFGTDPAIYIYGDKKFSEVRIFRADSTVFDVFDYEFKAGDPATALDHPSSMVLTENLAKKYFQEVTSGLGQTLQNQSGEVFKVTGIIGDVPLNSHFLFDALISAGPDANPEEDWGGFGAYTYIELPENYEVARLIGSLERIIKQKVDPVLGQYDLGSIII
jgi:putative ABC transport system permease protein